MLPQRLKISPVFTTKDAEKCGVSGRMLTYHIERGEIERVSRGVYRFTDYIPSDENIQWEELVIAVSNIKDGVICLVSALAVYGLTDEFMRESWIACPNAASRRDFPKTKIVRMRNMRLGKTHIKLGGHKVPIFDQERTIIDAFRQLSLETAVKALKIYLGREKPNIPLLLKYAKSFKVNIEQYITAITL